MQTPGEDDLGVLRRVPLFAAFDDVELAAVAAVCTDRRFRKGDVVCRAGDPGSDLLVVASGELNVLGTGSDPPEVVGRLGPGSCAGELALLLDQPRSATITCARAARVLLIDKRDFRGFILGDARALEGLTGLLSRRAVPLAQRPHVTLAATIVGVVADPRVDGASFVATAVAALAVTSPGGEVLLVRVREHGVPLEALSGRAEALTDSIVTSGGGPVLDVEARGVPGRDDLVSGIGAIAAALGERFRLIVVDLPQGATVDNAGEVCDVVVHVIADGQDRSPRPAPAGPHPRVLTVVNRHMGTGPPRPVNHCEPFVLPHEPSLAGLSADALAARVVAEPRLRAVHVLRRLARKIRGGTVGIALGAGAAYGIANVGVLLALEEAGILVDIVAGTSMGSIVAIGCAAGLSGLEMVAIAERIGNVRTTLSVLQPALNGVGLLNGKRLISIFSPLIDQETFDELVLPCRVVAMDVETGEKVEIGEGRLAEAFQASCAIPLVFSPVRRAGRTLVDGGMIDPVPADVARSMGADLVIGVNVAPRLERSGATPLSRGFRALNRLNPLSLTGGARHMPAIVDVLMNSIQVSQYELGAFKSLSADVTIDIDMPGFTWIEFYRALEIIEHGRESTKAAIGDVRAALDRRLSVGPAAP